MALLASIYSQVTSLIHTAVFKNHEYYIYWSLKERGGFQGCISTEGPVDIHKLREDSLSCFMNSSKLAVEIQSD